MARILTGLNKPTQGTLEIRGKKVKPQECLRHVAVVLQNADHQLYMRTVFDELLTSLFNAAPTDTMKKKWEQLQTMEKQVYTNIIYGKEDPSAFDQFVEDWKAQGGDDITKEVNEWYQSVK